MINGAATQPVPHFPTPERNRCAAVALSGAVSVRSTIFWVRYETEGWSVTAATEHGAYFNKCQGWRAALLTNPVPTLNAPLPFPSNREVVLAPRSENTVMSQFLKNPAMLEARYFSPREPIPTCGGRGDGAVSSLTFRVHSR